MWGTQITTPRNHRRIIHSDDRWPWPSLGGELYRDTNISIIHPCDINVDPLAVCPTIPLPLLGTPTTRASQAGLGKTKFSKTSKKRQPAVLVGEMGGMIS